MAAPGGRVDAGEAYSDEDEPGPRGQGAGAGAPHPDETREEREARRKRDEVGVAAVIRPAAAYLHLSLLP